MTPSDGGGPAPVEVRWHDDHHLRVGSVELRVYGSAEDPERDELYLLKWPELVHRYLDLADELRGGRIVELGVFEGGSTVFLAELLRPRSLVAVDLAPDPPPLLVRHLERSGDTERIHPHFGVDQADRAALRRILADDVDGPLDAVVDDASHLLGPTMHSFEVLFPLLRPGGWYVIEDWSGTLRLQDGARRGLEAALASTGGSGGALVAALARHLAERPALLAARYAEDPDALRRIVGHPQGAPPLEDAHPAVADAVRSGAPPEDVATLLGISDRPPLHRPLATRFLVGLVGHLVRAAVASPGIVASASVQEGIAIVRRGPEPVDPDGFDLLSLAPGPLWWPPDEPTG